jgi:hypothetical protein
MLILKDVLWAVYHHGIPSGLQAGQTTPGLGNTISSFLTFRLQTTIRMFWEQLSSLPTHHFTGTK